MKKDYFFGLSEEGFHKIAYTEWGVSSEHAAIICVHGLTRHSRDFDSLANYLSAQNNHVFCPDIVGRGDSDWLKNPLHYTYEQYLADMNVMMARTQAKEVNWIGTSMGGLIGMMLAALPYSPIKRLILNDVGPQIPVNAIARFSKYASPDPEFSSLSEAKQFFKKVYADFGHLSESQWDHFTQTSVREITPGQFISKYDQDVKTSHAKNNWGWRLLFHPHKALEGTLLDVDLWDIWRKITCPVLVIHGENSDILLPSIIGKMQTLHPNTQVIEIANTGHAPALLELTHHEMINQWLITN
jgi:pimeloyl-ACP methyl ester carboxylesterase